MSIDALSLLDAQLLNVAAPETSVDQLQQWADPLKAGCTRFGIDGVRPVAALLAQSAHESGGFHVLSENLSYSALRLTQVWPHRFPTIGSAIPYARNPEALANNVYANRMGNGDEASGDGWFFRGRGCFQLTGRANYAAFFAAYPDAPLKPDDLAAPQGAAMSACWFFSSRGLVALSMQPGCEAVTRAINGGLVGLDDRTQRFNNVVAELLRRGA